MVPIRGDKAKAACQSAVTGLDRHREQLFRFTLVGDGPYPVHGVPETDGVLGAGVWPTACAPTPPSPPRPTP